MANVSRNLIIAGPCAAESENQVIETALSLREIGVTIIRASLYKPRTQPGFGGVGNNGIPWLARLTREGLTVATEVLLPEHVDALVTGILQNGGDPERLIVWIGARNQNHLIQRGIAESLCRYDKTIPLLIKNQPWPDSRHWTGIVEHVLSAQLPADRLWLCHRGFAPGTQANPDKYRNIPDYEMALQVRDNVRKISGCPDVPMLIDPSHIGGSKENVMKVINESLRFGFDGYMIEVHQNPEEALTDRSQQLSLEEFQQIYDKITRKTA